MYRSLVKPNKIVSKRWDDRTMEIHKRKLQDVKPSQLSASPTLYSHVASKQKTV
jgi:hypothetical protein